MQARQSFVVAVLAALVVAQGKPAEAPATARVEGRVVDLRGVPVPAAEVWVTASQEPGTVLARGNCDGDGFFLFARVPVRESWQVFATADGSVVGEDFARPGGAPRTLLLHDAAVVRGVLRDRKGTPVAGA